jgi:hypothetical protein
MRPPPSATAPPLPPPTCESTPSLTPPGVLGQTQSTQAQSFIIYSRFIIYYLLRIDLVIPFLLIICIIQGSVI